MRKDVKRSLVLWPLYGSTLLISVCWIAGQSDPVSRGVASKLAQSWKLLGGPVFWHEAPAMADLLEESTTKPQSDATPDPSDQWSDVAKIESWTETPLDLVGYGKSETGVIGVPAPPLTSRTDLFGFPIADWTLQARSENGSAAMPRPERFDIAALLDSAEKTEPPNAIHSDESQEPVELFLEPAGGGISTSTALADEPILNKPIVQNENAASEESLNSGSEEIAPIIQIEPEMMLAQEQPLQSNSLESDAIRAQEQPSSSPAANAIADLAPVTEIPVTTEEEIKETPLSQFSESSAAIEPAVPTPAAQPESEELAKVANNSGLGRLLAEPLPKTWPLSARLLEQLEDLTSVSQRTIANGYFTSAGSINSSGDSGSELDLARWSSEVKEAILELPKSNRLGDVSTVLLLDKLSAKHQEAIDVANELKDDAQRVALLQAAYAIQRRLAVWRPVYEINSGENPVAQHIGDRNISVSNAISSVWAELPATGDEQGWANFLLLEELKSAYTSGEDRSRSELAQKFLRRIESPSLQPAHRAWMKSRSIVQLADAIRPWASTAVDYASLMHQIEKAESNAIDLVTADIAAAMKALHHARHPNAQQLARHLDIYYRNANVRLAIDENIIKRLLPEVPPRQVPVRTTLLGSRVNGMSQIESRLGIKLTPSPNNWRITLQTLGNVSTRSIGRSGPAAISTSSSNQFTATTPIIVHSQDIELSPSVVEVQGGSRLRGVNTKYDGWPVFGSLVRNIAESEYWKKASLSNRIANGRMQSQISEEVDRSIEQKVDEATQKFGDAVLGPLNRLRLEPKVIDLQTTESRLIARYRMAGDWQLAAMTPRPRAPGDSYLSLQVHQSAMNNTLEQLVVQDSPLPLPEMLQQCYSLLGVDPLPLPNEIPDDVMIQFAKHRPITTEISDGKVWVTMRVIRLQDDDRLKFRNFIVRASYVPVVDGLNVKLVREGHLSISGPGMSMRQRFPVRAIFNKVLSPNRELPLMAAHMLADRVPEGGAITQVELRDGWIGLAVGPERESGSIAGLKTKAAPKR